MELKSVQLIASQWRKDADDVPFLALVAQYRVAKVHKLIGEAPVHGATQTSNGC
jgi:hypothetical protein